MSKSILKAVIITIAFALFSCEKHMDYEPQAFFKGRQLEIAKAIYEGDEADLLKKLPLISQEELNKPAKAEMTLLFWAMTATLGDNATPERLHIISDLVRAGADPLQPQPNMPGSPAEAMLKADKGVWIKAMLDGGLSPNSRDKINDQPIIFQTRYAKNTETLAVMLDAGADIDIRNSLQQTLLMSAFISSSFEHVKLLIYRGSNPNPININNLSLLTLVKQQINDSKDGSEYNEKCKEILSLLVAHGAKD